MSKKYIDRTSSSRYSLSRSTSPSLLPSINLKTGNDFQMSIKKHLKRNLTQNIHNPELQPRHSIRYYMENEIQQQKKMEDSGIYGVLTSRRQALIENSKIQERRLSLPPILKEVPECQRYAERVEENLKKYGKGMLRRRHSNVLTKAHKEEELLQLHYRLKRQREQDSILRQEKAAMRKFKQLLSRYDSI